MRIDRMVYQDFYQVPLKLENTNKDVTYYDVTLHKAGWNGKILYKSEEVLGGEGYKTIKVPISKIKPDKMNKFYVCAQERGKEGQWGVVGRVCAKVRLYWPLAELKLLDSYQRQ